MYLVCSIYFVWLMLYEYVTNKKNTALLAFSCLLIAVLASIRYQVGVDYNSYFSMFHELLQDPESCSRIEVGWRYITYSLSWFGFNEYGCFAFWGSLTMLLVYYGLKKHAPYPLISCSFFFFGYTVGGLFNGMRQLVVCGIVIASLDVIKKRCHWKAAILFLIALSIHKVAILLIPIYFLVMYDSIIGKYKYWFLLCALLIGIGGYFLGALLAFSDYIPSETMAHSINHLITLPRYAEQEWGAERILLRLVLVLCILYFSGKLDKKWSHARCAIQLYYWGNIFAFLLLSSFTLSARVCYLVKILDILILPAFLLVTDDAVWKRNIMVLIIAWCLYAFCRTLFWGDFTDLVYPFRTIFDVR